MLKGGKKSNSGYLHESNLDLPRHLLYMIILCKLLNVWLDKIYLKYTDNSIVKLTVLITIIETYIDGVTEEKTPLILLFNQKLRTFKFQHRLIKYGFVALMHESSLQSPLQGNVVSP